MSWIAVRQQAAALPMSALGQSRPANGFPVVRFTPKADNKIVSVSPLIAISGHYRLHFRVKVGRSECIW
jgi:hypothetical protein